ncbi:hypothetical protein ACFQL9_13000 [Halobaculum lipolyticum]|uniref:Uncharacterized protein n=1 Tax=Halobaculum lipolyticum TaxID=3032001 RepID=A0ABD5WF11_9EURY
MSDSPPQPPGDLPEYVVDPLRRQSASRLRQIAQWASELAEFKQGNETPDPELQATIAEAVERAGHSANVADYSGVPNRAYLSVKTPDGTNQYAYWQWRASPEDDAPNLNEYICPVDLG